MSDLEQRRRTVRVLELLDDSFRAHQSGDDDACGRLTDEACDVDAFAVSVVQGGVRIGEIPASIRRLEGGRPAALPGL
jgi:hypothetical protein